MNNSEMTWTLNCLISELEQLKQIVRELEEKINERTNKNE